MALTTLIRGRFELSNIEGERGINPLHFEIILLV